jgi:hypothetical protein
MMRTKKKKKKKNLGCSGYKHKRSPSLMGYDTLNVEVGKDHL